MGKSGNILQTLEYDDSINGSWVMPTCFTLTLAMHGILVCILFAIQSRWRHNSIWFISKDHKTNNG